MRAADNVASIAAGLPRPLAVLWAEGLAEAAQLRAPERAAIRLQGQFLRWTLVQIVVSLPEHHPASVRGSGSHPLWSGRKLVDGTMLDHIHQLLKEGQFRPYTPGADIRAWYLDPRLNVPARLRHLVAVRNRHAHADSSLRGAEREAAKWLAECLRIVAEATWLRSWILFRLASQLPSDSRVKATWRCEPLRGPGLATEFPTLSLSGQGAAGEVFLRSPDGQAIVPLAPFVLWEDGRLLTPSGFRTDRRINHIDPMRDAEGPEVIASPRQTHFALEPIAVVPDGPMSNASMSRAPISLVTLDAHLSPVPVPAAPLPPVAPPPNAAPPQTRISPAPDPRTRKAERPAPDDDSFEAEEPPPARHAATPSPTMQDPRPRSWMRRVLVPVTLLAGVLAAVGAGLVAMDVVPVPASITAVIPLPGLGAAENLAAEDTAPNETSRAYADPVGLRDEAPARRRDAAPAPPPAAARPRTPAPAQPAAVETAHGMKDTAALGAARGHGTGASAGSSAAATAWDPPAARRITVGQFRLGSPPEERGRRSDEGPREVRLTRSFEIDETETTQAQWIALMGSNPSFHHGCGEQCPVESVNWYEALAFANARSAAEGLPPCYELVGCSGILGEGNTNLPLGSSHDGSYRCETVRVRTPYDTGDPRDCAGYRLPTEAEWEYAARAGTTTETYAGNVERMENSTRYGLFSDGPRAYRGRSLGDIAVYAGHNAVDYPGARACEQTDRTLEVRGTLCGIRPVRGHRSGNPWGLYDMLGNAREWVWDGYGSYDEIAEVDPVRPPGDQSLRVIRGGGWSTRVSYIRSAHRTSRTPETRSLEFGFRLARTIWP